MKLRSILFLMASLVVIQGSKADSVVNFSFSVAAGQCAVYGISCADSGSGTFTVNPPQNDQFYYGASPITSMTGTLDGSAMSFVAQGYPGLNNYGPNSSFQLAQAPYDFPALFLSDNQQWGLWRNDLFPGWSDFLVNYTTGAEEPIYLTLTPEVVTTVPEPPVWMLIVAGLLAWLIVSLVVGNLWGRFVKFGEGGRAAK